ncbi:MAG TPA: NAD(P)/FAD-dependent oxidoreductase [Candidatus Acidoferrales bacterium]|nr:NAD(P)/FAD-dependent oxidoreductase [Candidatus Acidoferrales bacterium]
MPRIVIAGGGFAGLSAARWLQKHRGAVRGLETVLIDRHNYMLFTPMLPEAATGSVELRHITQPFRAQLRAVQFELGEILSVDEERRCVAVQHPITHETRAISYDRLILALGSTPSSKGVPGVERFTYPLRTVSDAERLRNAVLGAVEVASRSCDGAERDRLMRFVIVGGGFTGVEIAGELSAFLRSIVRYYPGVDRRLAQIVLIQAEDRLLPHLPQRFGKRAARVLFDRGVEIRTCKDVARIDSGGLTLEGGERFESRTIVWSAGEEPAPFVKRLGLKLSENGAIVTERDFAVPGHPHLMAIGDCAAVPKKEGGTHAPLAQNATREGPLAARNAVASLRGGATKPFDYEEVGQMASLGDRSALAELPGKRMLYGLPAWLLWRTYYLGRLPGFGRKTRVALDWGLGVAFGPALARLPLVERAETSFEESHAVKR